MRPESDRARNIMTSQWLFRPGAVATFDKPVEFQEIDRCHDEDSEASSSWLPLKDVREHSRPIDRIEFILISRDNARIAKPLHRHFLLGGGPRVLVTRDGTSIHLLRDS